MWTANSDKSFSKERIIKQLVHVITLACLTIRYLKVTRALCDLTYPTSEVALDLKDAEKKTGFQLVKGPTEYGWNQVEVIQKQSLCIPAPPFSPLLPQCNYFRPLERSPLIFNITPSHPPPPQPAAVLHLSGKPSIIGSIVNDCCLMLKDQQQQIWKEEEEEEGINYETEQRDRVRERQTTIDLHNRKIKQRRK